MAVYLGSQLKTLNGGIPINGGSGPTPTGTIEISANGMYNVEAFASASVNVSGGGDDISNALIQRQISGYYSNSTVSVIGSYAFYSCLSLTSVSFAACTSISSSAFYYCKNLESINFPVCKVIGSYAFAYCSSSLTLASFPSCTTINPNAFNYCTTLASANFPVCSNIGSSAFNYCPSLTSISFPICKIIYANAFNYCNSLTSATFTMCSSIGASAFRNCHKLESLYILSTSVCTLGAGAFISTPMSLSSYLGYFGSIYVPSTLLSSYQTATNWVSYATRLVGVNIDNV